MAFSLNSGALVLYHGKFAAVTAINKEKIEIRIEGGAAKSVRPKDVEFLHRGPVSVLPPKLLPGNFFCSPIPPTRRRRRRPPGSSFRATSGFGARRKRG